MKQRFLYIGLALLLCAGLADCKSHQQATQASTNATSPADSPDKKNGAPEKGVVVEVVEGLNLGNKAPEIEMADPSGKLLKLSSLKGKLVLIDFWASWCGPCRAENPAVIAAYTTYHEAAFVNGKGFEVFSVSLDSDRNRWVAAIEKDKLLWPYHVCDMLMWNNAAAQKYRINSIPANFLVDENGIIVAKGLRGEDLQKKLASLKK